MNYNELKVILIRKKLIILFCSLLFSLGLVAEKTISGNFQLHSGRVLVSSIVKIENYEYLFDNSEASRPFNFKEAMKTNYWLNRFLEETENKYDYSKLFKGWDTKSKDEKLQFLSSVMEVRSYEHGIYELRLCLEDDIPQNTEYLRQAAPRYVDDFVVYFEKMSKLVNPQTAVSVIGRDEVFPVQKAVNKITILTKYGIIGFILGAVLSMVVVIGTALGLKKDDK